MFHIKFGDPINRFETIGTMSTGPKEFVEERVAFTADNKKKNRFNARISVSKTGIGSFGGKGKVEKSFRSFQTEDVSRVMDFEDLPDPPPDGPMMHCENETDFPSRHFALRGGFLFYFGLGDVSGTGRSNYVTYHGPPKGVIPLDKCKVEVPPGGRRVFREHAQTNARTGYELAIIHMDPNVERQRPPAFVVAESMAQREKWAKAIQARAEIDGYTKLRASSSYTDPSLLTKPADVLQERIRKTKQSARAESKKYAGSARTHKEGKRSTRKKRGARKDKSKGDGKEDVTIQEVLKEFGKSSFSQNAWLDNYFETHNEADSATKCKLMEKQQGAIKRGLQGAVLEQYEYFVEASGEMTKMGREVVDLKTLVETQVETIKEMKEIDFSGAILDPIEDDNDEDSEMSSVYSEGDDSQRNRRLQPSTFGRSTMLERITIEIPPHLEEVGEEILAYVKESRYTDATDLWAKTKQEVSEIMQQVRYQKVSWCLENAMSSYICLNFFFLLSTTIFSMRVQGTKN